MVQGVGNGKFSYLVVWTKANKISKVGYIFQVHVMFERDKLLYVYINRG